MSRSFLVLIIVAAIFIGLSPLPTHAKHTCTCDLTIGTNIVSLQPSFTLQLGTAETVAWHPTQDKLAVGGKYGVTIYDSTFNVIHELREPLTESLYLTWSPDGNQIAVSSPSFIATWNVESESLDQVIFTDSYRSVAWSPGGQYIAGTGSDAIAIVDVSIGEVTATLDADGYEFNSIDWGPIQGIGQDSDQIVSESNDGIIRVWDISTQTVAQSYEQSGLLLRSVAWNHNTNQIASVSDTSDIYIWDVATQGISKAFTSEAVGWISQLRWLPDNQLVSISLDSRIDTWDIADEQPQPTLVITWETNNWTEAFDINALGTKFAGINRQRQIPTRDNIIWIKELPSGQTITSLLNYGDAVTALSWDSQSRQLVSGSFDMYLRLWDTNNGALIVRTPLPPWMSWSLDSTWSYISSFNENGESQTISEWDQSLNTLFENPPSAPIAD